MARRRRKTEPDLTKVLLAFLAAALVIAVGTTVYLLCAPEQTEPSEPIVPTAAENEYEPDAFVMRDGFLHYEEAPYMIGMDVSTHQGLIDWQAVADAGVEFAILRVGYRGSTEGKLYEDEQFRENFAGARAAGLKIGVYFFSQALTAEEAEEEAAFACRLLDGEKLDLPVFYDWEEVSGGSRVESAAAVPMTDCAIAFCETVERKGYTAGVYFNQNYGYGHLELEQLQDYTLWLAEYGDSPSFRYHFDCLQYTDSGTVNGIEGSVDLDLWISKDSR